MITKLTASIARRTVTLSAASLLGAGLLLATTADAAVYGIYNGTLSDVRLIGARSVPNALDYAGVGDDVNDGTLDATNPMNWQPMVGGFSTWDVNDPTTPPVAGGVGALVGGTINHDGVSVTGAVINMLANEVLKFGTFQSCTSSDPNASGGNTTADPNYVTSPCTISDMVTRNLVWTYNPVTGKLLHANDGIGGDSAFQGTTYPAQNFNRLAICEPAAANYGGGTGTALTGSCRTFRALTNNGSELSLWSWQGVNANYSVQDAAQVPWQFTNTGATINVGGASGHAPVTWDLSGFTPGVGGQIIAHVTSMAISLTNQDRTAIYGKYTFDVVLIPVPAAVWLFGSALGLIGWLRRRATV